MYQFFDLFTNNARELKVAESNTIIENITGAFSLSVGWSFFLFIVRILSLSHYLFGDAALQLLLCGVISAVILINAEL